jgi:hypothetical protein
MHAYAVQTHDTLTPHLHGSGGTHTWGDLWDSATPVQCEALEVMCDSASKSSGFPY